MSTSMLTRKGQATIPKAVRDRLGIAPGDRVRFAITPMGRVVILPKSKSLADLQGLLAKPDKPASLADIERASKPND